MNLVEESYNKKQDKTKKIAKIILIVILLLVILIIGIMSYIMYLKSTELKVSLDGATNAKIKSLLLFEEDGSIYVPIRQMSELLGFSSYNGEYTNRSEITSKCFIQTEKEAINFTANSNKIYKLLFQNSSQNYDYYYLNKPVKSKDGVLYISTDDIQTAYNASFSYDQKTNRIDVYSLEYLVTIYQQKALEYGYTELSTEFKNNIAILDNILIAKKDKYYGVMNISTGEIILETKYDNITYLDHSKEFLVESNRKVGIATQKKDLKIQILYDKIELMDNDAGLYLVQKDKKYGIIDTKGVIKLYTEYDEIGIDITKFPQNEIKSKYILADTLIPVRKDKFWGVVDKNGKVLIDFELDSFGYIASTNKDAINLLEIPLYNVIVAEKNDKYTLISASGEKLYPIVLDDVYMTISSDEKKYYIILNGKTYDAEEQLEMKGIKSNTNKSINKPQNVIDENTIKNVTNTNNTNQTTNSNE